MYSNVMFYHMKDGVLDGEKYERKLREYYDGPLMPMNVRAWGREHQEFWYRHDVDQEAEKAMEWFEKEAGRAKICPVAW